MQASNRKIVVLGTGGTIAGAAESPEDDRDYVAGRVGIDRLLHGVAVPVDCAVVAEQVAQLDSKDMDFPTWVRLALRCDHWLGDPTVAGLVVTHGTDTLEETAFLLDVLLAPAKPLVLTGAMRPATSAAADGPRNLADAIAVAAAAQARGVLVTFAGEIHAARTVTKAFGDRLAAFASPGAAALGHVAAGRVVLDGRPVARQARHPAFDCLTADMRWPDVQIVTSHAGADGRVVDALLAAGDPDGLVVAATGGGTVHAALEAALLRAQARGVRVVRASRCASGGVVDRPGDRFAHAGDLSPVKARVALLLDLLQERCR